MDILLYISEKSETASRLQRSIASLPLVDQLIECHNLTELAGKFSSPAPLPGIVILPARDEQELDAFFDFRLRLKNQFLVLILFDSKATTIARSHQLYPRFITYHDSDFLELQAVLEQLVKSRPGYLATGKRDDPFTGLTDNTPTF